jgi:microcystin-dependent protein
MKKQILLPLLFLAFCSLVIKAQTPQGINYQAVARAADGQVLANAKINVRFSVFDGGVNGTMVYRELHQVSTNQFGLFTAIIGAGETPEGAFDNISWSSGNKFLQVEIDVQGNGNFVNMGTQQMMAVPYALYAAHAGSADNTSNKVSGSSGSSPSANNNNCQQGLTWNCQTHTLTANGQSVQISNCNGSFGATGPAGPQGPTGAQGSMGSRGATGPTGATGLQGTRGITGPAGAEGPQGPEGATGAKGAKGHKGVTGPQGPIGATGNTGAQGPQGPAGATGSNGTAGPQGPQGATGPQGPAGMNGSNGATGNDGAAGLQGATGPQGAEGATGPQGPAGTPGNNVPDGVNTNDLLVWDASGNDYIAKSITTGNTGGGQAFSILQPYLAVNFCIAVSGIFPSRSGEDPFVGEIEMFGFNFAPVGWELCNGQLLPINQYQALFVLIGTQFGGDGITNFALPNLQGRVPLAMGNLAGGSSYIIGQSGGSETNTLTIGQMPAHNHTIVFGAP